MFSKIAGILKLSPTDKDSIAETTDRFRSVAEFVEDVVEATKDTNFLEALTQCMPWWIQAVGESVAEAAPPIKFVATLLGKLGEIKDPNELAFLAFTVAYQRSLEKAVTTVGPPSSITKFTESENGKDESETDEDWNFDTYSLSDPLNHPFLEQSKKILTARFRAAGYTEDQVRSIQNEIAMRFPGCLRAIVSHPSTRQKYAAFADSLQQGTKENRVHLAWNDHFEYQRYQFEDKRVFVEEPFSLSEIYVDTECGSITCEELWETPSQENTALFSNSSVATNERSNDPFDENFGGRHDLLETVINLIGDRTFTDAIVVQGAAGAGKSAFTLRLALELLRKGLRPIRIRFRDIPLQQLGIDDALPEAVRFWDPDQREGDLPAARADELFLDMALFDQTVPFGDTQICPYVIILDGWDEVSVAAERGFAMRVREILSDIRGRFLERGNRPRVRVVLTGRPSSAVPDSGFLKKSTRLLTIRPLKPDSLERFVTSLAPRLCDSDKPEAVAPTRFEAVLSRYRKEFEGRKKNGNNKNAGTLEVLGLPLLTHLAVRLMVRWPHSDLIPLVENPTTLYRQLTNLTCERGGRVGRDAFDPRFPGIKLRKLLHETAAAMTVFGQDSIPYEELDERLTELNRDLYDRVEEITREHPVSSLMINFFFKGGRKELGAEFLHKSFREFLFAEAIVETLKDYGRTAPKDIEEKSTSQYRTDFQPNDPRYALSRRLGRLLGPQWITQEVSRFIEGLIQWELERSREIQSEDNLGTTTTSLNLDGWQSVANGLADLWNWWGEGVHLRIQPEYRGRQVSGWSSPYAQELVHWAMPQITPRGETPVAPRITTIDGHLGDGIFRLSCLVHHFLGISPNDDTQLQAVNESSQDTPTHRRYQSISMRNGKPVLRFAPSGLNKSYFQYYAARINAVGWHPETVFPSGIFMESIDLSGCFLPVMGFEHARLRGSNLRGTNLTGAYFQFADLRECDFTASHGTGTNFLNCQFDGAIASPITDKKRKRSE